MLCSISLQSELHVSSVQLRSFCGQGYSRAVINSSPSSPHFKPQKELHGIWRKYHTRRVLNLTEISPLFPFGLGFCQMLRALIPQVNTSECSGHPDTGTFFSWAICCPSPALRPHRLSCWLHSVIALAVISNPLRRFLSVSALLGSPIPLIPSEAVNCFDLTALLKKASQLCKNWKMKTLYCSLNWNFKECFIFRQIILEDEGKPHYSEYSSSLPHLLITPYPQPLDFGACWGLHRSVNMKSWSTISMQWTPYMLQAN